MLRAATEADTETVLDLLDVAARNDEFAFGTFDRERVRLAVRDCIQHGAVLLSLSGGLPVATLGLLHTGVWWTAQPVLQEYWVFVRPEHRRAPHARGMLRAARDIARDAGLPLLIGVLSTRRTAGKVRLFSQEFGMPAGATFVVGG